MDKTGNIKIFAVLLIVTMILIFTVYFSFIYYGEPPDFEKEEIVLKNSEGKEIDITVEIADTKTKQSHGLQNRESLEDNHGMLFLFEKDVHHSFNMKDTLIPLSIAFISEDGTIMEQQEMEPETTTSHKPESSYRYALEVNQGFFEENKIEVGSTVIIPEHLI